MFLESSKSANLVETEQNFQLIHGVFTRMQYIKRRFPPSSSGLINSSKVKAPYFGLLVLWIIAFGLALFGLGDLPLRDFDESTVARVAYELSHKQGAELLLPTLWDVPYLNKPPGLHWLIALAMNVSGHFQTVFVVLPSEFVVRLVPAVLSTFVVPFGGLIQWYLRPFDRIASLATASILLTLLPVARHGRLAMLDGTQLTAMALLWLLLLSVDRTSTDRWRAFGAGLISSYMLLLKAPLLIPASLAALIPIIWGGHLKLFLRLQILGWMLLGLFPGIAWHIFNAFQRGTNAFWLWGGDGIGRVLFSVGEGSDLGWRVPLIEIVEGGWPWLLLWPFGVYWAWRERKSTWGKWSLGSQIVLAISILPLKTQLPWYSHPLWLPFAILCGLPLAWLVRLDNSAHPPGRMFLKRVPLIWFVLGLGLIIFGLSGLTGLVINLRPYSAMSIAVGFGWSTGSWLLGSSNRKERIKGTIIILLGSLTGLFILMASPLWLWELNETWSVEPLAKLASRTKTSNLSIEGSEARPSLNWYAGKRIYPLKLFPNAESILTRNPQSLINKELIRSRECKVMDYEGDWSLLACSLQKQNTSQPI